MLAASYGSSVHTFTSPTPPTTPNSFTPTTGKLDVPNFKDHDDVNLWFDDKTGRWVDFQVSCTLINHCYTVCTLINHYYTVSTSRSCTSRYRTSGTATTSREPGELTAPSAVIASIRTFTDLCLTLSKLGSYPPYLCTHSTLTMHSLSTHYPLTIHSLSTHYPLTIHSPSTHYPLQTFREAVYLTTGYKVGIS
jgi:hypothetical protein